MQHIQFLKSHGHHGAALTKSASGRFYTGELIGRRLAVDAVEKYFASKDRHEVISLLEPFAGDGRLVSWFIEEWIRRGYPKVEWNIELWELDKNSLQAAKANVEASVGRYGTANVIARMVDSFRASQIEEKFDVLLTNPPWDVIKPDRRELLFLTEEERASYVDQLKEYDKFLSSRFPLSQPAKKFAGWGTNLSRVGLEASLGLLGKGGVCGIILPSSFAADTQTSTLRAWVINNFTVSSIIYYPAEMNQFEGADTGAVAVCIESNPLNDSRMYIGRYVLSAAEVEGDVVDIEIKSLARSDFVLPVTIGSGAMKVISRMSEVGCTWGELEVEGANRLWAGREVDETRIAKHLVSLDSSLPAFIKGRMVGRFGVVRPTHAFSKPQWKPPKSMSFRRIAWRDVSRPSQRRRMVATIIDAGTVSGNSIGVAYFEDANEVALLSLLGIINSTSFEISLKASLATGHISLSTLRKMPVPSYDALAANDELAGLVSSALLAGDEIAADIDAFVAARIYKLDAPSYEWVLSQFAAFSEDDRNLMLETHRSYLDPK